MEKSYFKVFFSKYKECDWLNRMGEKGYFLTKISDSRYYFKCSDEHKYKYSIEYLNVSAKSDEAISYYDSRRNYGVFPFISSDNWVYFYVEDGNIEDSLSIHQKNAVFYFWRSLYLFFFTLVSAVLCGYHYFAGDFIKRAGHSGNGSFGLLEVKGTSFLDTLKSLWNNVLEFINNTYLKLFALIFGENDSSIVLAFLIPVVIVLTVLFALNLNEFVTCKIKCKKFQAVKVKGEEDV